MFCFFILVLTFALIPYTKKGMGEEEYGQPVKRPERRESYSLQPEVSYSRKHLYTLKVFYTLKVISFGKGM